MKASSFTDFEAARRFVTCCLRFTTGVTARHARLASGWRAAPLPGGSRTRWIATRGFSSCHPPLQGFPWRNNPSGEPWNRSACCRSGRAPPPDLLRQRSFPASPASELHGSPEGLPTFVMVPSGRGAAQSPLCSVRQDVGTLRTSAVHDHRSSAPARPDGTITDFPSRLSRSGADSPIHPQSPVSPGWNVCGERSQRR